MHGKLISFLTFRKTTIPFCFNLFVDVRTYVHFKQVSFLGLLLARTKNAEKEDEDEDEDEEDDDDDDSATKLFCRIRRQTTTIVCVYKERGEQPFLPIFGSARFV